MSDFPRTVEEIMPEWLTQVLRESGAINSATVERCTTQLFPEGFSNSGLLARVTLEYEKGQAGPSTLIAKLPHPSRPAPSIVRGAYEREIHFYREFGRNVGVKVPRMYFGDFVAGEEVAIILLEDLAPLEPGDSLDGCSYEEGLAAVKGLANMQARWWNRPEIVGNEWLWSFSNAISLDQFSDSIATGWEKIPASSRENLPASISTIDGLGDWIIQVGNELESGPLTLCHPDYRLDNIFFDHRAEDIKVTVIDFGRIARMRGGFALAMFLAGESGMNTNQINSCVTEYWNALRSNGVDSFSYDECLRDFRLGVLMLLGQRLLQYGRQLHPNAPGRLETMRTLSWDRAVQAFDHFDCVEVIPK